METLLIVSSVLLWLVVLFNFLITLTLIQRININASNLHPTQKLKIGQVAPELPIENFEGEKINLLDGITSLTVLVFISNDCSVCKEVLPSIQQLARDIKKTTDFFLISFSNKAQTQLMIEQFNIELPLVLGNPLKITEDYGLKGVPAFCAIDAQHTIQSIGIVSDERWEQMTNQWKVKQMTV